MYRSLVKAVRFGLKSKKDLLFPLRSTTFNESLQTSRCFSTVKPNEETNTKSTTDEGEPKVDDATTQLQDEIKELNKNLSEMKEKYQRSIAENENVRMRLRREITDAKLYAIQGFCKDLLEVADVLDKAVHSIPEDVLVAKNHPDHTHWKNFYDGVDLTKSQLLKVFKRYGLVPLSPERGDKFDPNVHEALFQAPVEDLAPGMVAHITSKGYILHGRTIRPAQVGVSAAAS